MQNYSAYAFKVTKANFMQNPDAQLYLITKLYTHIKVNSVLSK